MKKILSICAFLCAAFMTMQARNVEVGAEQTKQYLPLLKGKRVALLSNHTGIVIQGKDTIHTLSYKIVSLISYSTINITVNVKLLLSCVISISP